MLFVAKGKALLKKAGGSTGQISHVGSPTFTVPLYIGPQCVSALVDTGANVSCIQHSVLTLVPHIRLLHSAVGNLFSASGQPIPVMGSTCVPFELDGGQFVQQFQVVLTLAYPVILSFDFLATSSYLAPIFSNTTFRTFIYRFRGNRRGDLTAGYIFPLKSGLTPGSGVL